MGLADLAGAGPAVLALSHHQSARAIPVVQQEPAIGHRPEAKLMADRPAILVTGGAGYIGSHCCRALDSAGYQPVCYDNFSTRPQGFVTRGLGPGGIHD